MGGKVAALFFPLTNSIGGSEMNGSMERLAMLDDVHGAGRAAMEYLAAAYGLTTRAIYKWLEAGFPQRWSERDHEVWRERFLRATGGAHLRSYWQALAARGQSRGGRGLAAEMSDVGLAGAQLVKLAVEAMEDGDLSEGERLDLQGLVRRLKTELAEAEAALEREGTRLRASAQPEANSEGQSADGADERRSTGHGPAYGLRVLRRASLEGRNAPISVTPRALGGGRHTDEDTDKGRLTACDYGYAITGHKAQGSEWPRVLILEERCSAWSHERWLYTALTRAKETAWIARSNARGFSVWRVG